MTQLTVPQPTAQNEARALKSFTCVVNKDLELIEASSGWFEFFSISRKKTIGQKLYTIFPHFENDHADSFEYCLEGVHDIKIIDATKYIKEQNGTLVWNLNPWKDGYGNIIGIVMSLKYGQENFNADKAKQLNNQLEKNQEVGVGSWEYNVGEAEMIWSNKFKLILGIPENSVGSVQKSFSFLENSEERLRLRNLVREAMTTGRPWDENFKIKDFNGNFVTLNTIGRPKFKNGKCSRIIGVIQHINNEELSEARPTTVFQEDYFDNVPTGLAVIDFETDTLLNINNHLLGLFDKKRSFFLNKPLNEFIEIDHHTKNEIEESLTKYFSFKNAKVNIKHKSLGQLVLNVSGNLIKNKQGKEVLLVSCDDFTKRASLEYTFSSSLNRAHEEIDKMVHFAHMVSHNLKAHTTNFDLLLNFLHNEENEKEREHLMQLLFQSSDNLTSTIRSLRELVAIRHMVNEQKSVLNVNDCLYKVIQSNNGLIKKINAKVHNEIDEEFNVCAIPAYLESILANLLQNALNFMNENERPIIYLNCSVEAKHHVITIEDNSMGINLEKEGDKVFALYRKLQNMGDNTSMGLYLTKYQIELMGGKIAVQSEVGKGNTFKVYFPM